MEKTQSIYIRNSFINLSDIWRIFKIGAKNIKINLESAQQEIQLK